MLMSINHSSEAPDPGSSSGTGGQPAVTGTNSDASVATVGTGQAPSSGDGGNSGTQVAGEPRHPLKKLFSTWPRRIATAAGATAFAALIGLAINLMVAGWQAPQLRADNDTLRDQVTGLQIRVDSLQRQLASQQSANTALQADVRSLESSKAALTSSLCNILRSAVVSGQLSLSSQAESACGPVFPLLSVERPRPADIVPMATEASGTVDVSKLDGQTIWFGVTTPGVPGFFLEGNWPAKTGPATITPEGDWTSPGLFVGQAGDTGKPFDIVIILAGSSAANQFWNYLQQGAATGKYPPIEQLPAGAHEFTRVDVIRK